MSDYKFCDIIEHDEPETVPDHELIVHQVVHMHQDNLRVQWCEENLTHEFKVHYLDIVGESRIWNSYYEFSSEEDRDSFLKRFPKGSIESRYLYR